MKKVPLNLMNDYYSLRLNMHTSLLQKYKYIQQKAECEVYLSYRPQKISFVCHLQMSIFNLLKCLSKNE